MSDEYKRKKLDDAINSDENTNSDDKFLKIFLNKALIPQLQKPDLVPVKHQNRQKRLNSVCVIK